MDDQDHGIRSASDAADQLCEVVITGPDIDWLTGFTRELVEDRLAACGQHIATVRSIYRWQGGIQDEPEARAALHTRRTLVTAIIERANQRHPYDVPCVLAVPLIGVHPAYAEWVLAETAGAVGQRQPSSH